MSSSYRFSGLVLLGLLLIGLACGPSLRADDPDPAGKYRRINAGEDFGTLGQARTYSIGVNIGF